MERYFRMEDDTLCNVIEHTKDQIASKDGLKIYIATDSQVHKKTIHFATVIVYRYGTNGAHYIYNLDTVPRKQMDLVQRLFDEGNRTITTALMLREGIPAISIEALEFDYNGIKKTKSQPLVSTMKGWAKGLEFNPVFKGGQMIASKAGDHICRKKEPK